MIKKIITFSFVIGLTTLSLSAKDACDKPSDVRVQHQEQELKRVLSLFEDMSLEEQKLVLKELKSCNDDHVSSIDMALTLGFVALAGGMVLTRLAIACFCEPERCVNGRGDDENLMGNTGI